METTSSGHQPGKAIFIKLNINQSFQGHFRNGLKRKTLRNQLLGLVLKSTEAQTASNEEAAEEGINITRDTDSEIFEFHAQLLNIPESLFLERPGVSVQENCRH